MTTVRAAAIYARISSDQDGHALGVKRQLADCRKLANEQGWTVAEEYVDNDVSAYSGKTRPAFTRMLQDIAAGTRDAVLVYHVDRLTRRPIELEEFVQVLDDARVRHVRFVTGPSDLFTGDGLLAVRITGAFAAHESAAKSRRLRRKAEEIAAAGRPNGGSVRPYGYEPDRITVRPDEAEVIRTLLARLLAGESWRSLATWLNDQEVPTVTGARWRTPTLRNILLNPRYAGLREHLGQVVGPAVWEPIISVEEHRRAVAVVAEKVRSGRRAPRRYMLSGMLICGRCGNRLFSAARETTRRYVCSSGPDHGGCGRLTVVADPLERFIADAVLLRLDSPEMQDVLAGRAARDERLASVVEASAKDRAKLEELGVMWAEGQISKSEFLRLRQRLDGKIRDAQRQIERAQGDHALTGLPGNGDALAAEWVSLGLDRQQKIVAAVLDHAVIAPGVPGVRSLDIGRVQPVWRL